MAPVSATRSSAPIPLMTIAIASAPTCASLMEPSVMPATSHSISSALSADPSRLRRMTS
jgi:hypothetical protein